MSLGAWQGQTARFGAASAMGLKPALRRIAEHHINLNAPLTFANATTTSGVFPAQAHIFAIRFADILPTLCSTRPDIQSQQNKAVNTWMAENALRTLVLLSYGGPHTVRIVDPVVSRASSARRASDTSSSL